MSVDFQYTTAPDNKHGTMQCSLCQKPIHAGDYRVYKKNRNGDWGYLTQHRACTKSDPQWAKIDAERDAAEMPDRAFEALRYSQRQLDPDGIMVGISRQALDEVLDAYASATLRLRGQQVALIEAHAELIYLRLYGKDGALWSANESKDVWRQKARDAIAKAEGK